MECPNVSIADLYILEGQTGCEPSNSWFGDDVDHFRPRDLIDSSSQSRNTISSNRLFSLHFKMFVFFLSIGGDKRGEQKTWQKDILRDVKLPKVKSEAPWQEQ